MGAVYSMIYPMRIETCDLDHKGQTKAYHLVMILSANGNSIVINRWGKIGVFGDVQVMKYSTCLAAEVAFSKKIKEKKGRGYGEVSGKEVFAANATELRAAIGRILMTKIGASNLLHLDPDFDVSGFKHETDAVAYDEEGRKIDSARRSDHEAWERAVKEKQQAEADLAAKEMQSLPTFGMF